MTDSKRDILKKWWSSTQADGKDYVSEEELDQALTKLADLEKKKLEKK